MGVAMGDGGELGKVTSHWPIRVSLGSVGKLNKSLRPLTYVTNWPSQAQA